MSDKRVNRGMLSWIAQRVRFFVAHRRFRKRIRELDSAVRLADAYLGNWHSQRIAELRAQCAAEGEALLAMIADDLRANTPNSGGRGHE